MARWVCVLMMLSMATGCKSEGEVGDAVENLGRATGPVSAGAPAPNMGAMPPSATEPSQVVISGEVLETIDASRYTYVKIRGTDGAEVWAAVPQIKLTSGEPVAVIQSLVMKDFKSKTLNRVFSTVIFGVLKRQADSGISGGMGMGTAGDMGMTGGMGAAGGMGE